MGQLGSRKSWRRQRELMLWLSTHHIISYPSGSNLISFIVQWRNAWEVFVRIILTFFFFFVKISSGWGLGVKAGPWISWINWTWLGKFCRQLLTLASSFVCRGLVIHPAINLSQISVDRRQFHFIIFATTPPPPSPSPATPLTGAITVSNSRHILGQSFFLERIQMAPSVYLRT